MKKKLYLLIIPILLILYLFTPRLIKIKNIICQNQFGACSDYLVKKFPPKGLTLPDSKNSLRRELSLDLRVIKYSIKLKLPDTLVVNLIERKPIIAWSFKDGNFVSVDKDGFIVSETQTTGLPIITTDEKIDYKKVGYLPKEMKFATYLTEDFSSIYGKTNAIYYKDRLEVVSQNNVKIIFPLEGDRDLIIGSARLILSRLNSLEEAYRIKDEGFSVISIDIRFKNPVIKIS